MDDFEKVLEELKLVSPEGLFTPRRVNAKLDQAIAEFKKWKKELGREIKEIKNPYPKDVFVGRTEEGKVGQFGHKVWENFRAEVIALLEGDER
jgi:hypothetical protein